MELLRSERLSRPVVALVFGAVMVIAFSRSPYALLHGRFYGEEGRIYFAHMTTGSFWFVAHRVGYVYAFANIATWLAARVPLEQAPLVTAWLSFGIIAAIVWSALCLPSDLLTTAAARIAAAILLVVGPLALPELWLNATNAQSYLGILAILLLFVDVDRLGRASYVAVAALLVLAGLSGLYAAALAPLFIVRAVRVRTRRRTVVAALITACAAIQLVTVQISHATGDLAEGRGSFRGLGVITRDVAASHFTTFVFGNSIATNLHAHAYSFVGLFAFAVFATIIGATLAVLLALAPARHVAVLLGAAFVIEEALVLFGTRRTAGGRYMAVPIAILLLIVIHVMTTTTVTHRGAAGVAAALCGVTLIAGTSVFWTGQPSVLRCIDCPDWKQQVRVWRTGRTDRLVTWPYVNIRWTVVVPHAPPKASPHEADGADVVHPRSR